MKNEKKGRKLFSFLFVDVFDFFLFENHPENKRENANIKAQRNSPEANNNRRQQIAVRLCVVFGLLLLLLLDFPRAQP